ncbi:AAEL002685-PA, partial [Aedes aegypti]
KTISASTRKQWQELIPFAIDWQNWNNSSIQKKNMFRSLWLAVCHNKCYFKLRYLSLVPKHLTGLI